jgi:hypothetical protein
MKPFEKWTVLPHGRLSRIEDNILSVVGELPMPLGKFPRRMTIVRLADARLIVFSAIALDASEMEAVEAFGTPTFLIVPNDIHRMDARVWKKRYPSMTVIAPSGARDKVQRVVPVDATSIDFDDPSTRMITVPGTAERELALEVTTPDGVTLVVNDLIWSVADRPGFSGWLFKAVGATGPSPKIPRVVELREIKDKKAVRAQLETWARLPNLNRIIVSHGDIVAANPGGTLARLAGSLAA